MEKIFLNNDWGFTESFSQDLTKVVYDGKLQQVRLPHTCKETPLHYFDESLYQMVSGYRKEIDIPSAWEKKRVFLTFDGVAHACRVFINGEQVGEHHCGYTAFTVELTGKLRYGEKNILAVEVDSRESLNVPPFGFVIDYMTFGGIYRDVYFQIGESVCLEDVFVRTSHKKKFRVKTQVTLNGVVPAKCSIRQFLCKKGGEYVLLGEIPCEENMQNTEFEIPADSRLGKIKRWDVEHPNLYQLKTQIVSEEKVLDEREDTFGFRSVLFRKDGFYLNGKKVKIRGLNRHQSYPYIGYAAPKSLQVNDAEILKYELGVNAVRTSHYPQSHYFLDRCDELGLLVFTEMPGWQHIGDAKWKEQAVKNTEDMVIQYRNHPSIIIWGVRINESVDDDEFYKKTNEVAHRLDPTRQTGGVRCIKKSNLLEDVYTYNEFVHEGNNKGCELKKTVTSDVEKAYLITEYGGHMFPTKSYDCEDKRVEHALRHANVLDAVAEQEDIAGSFGWCMFDYNTHKDFGSGDRVCYHGVMDMFRNPKLAAAVYASQQEQTPVLVPGSSMDIGEHPGCNRGQIYVFTNADSVRMYKNNELVREYQSSDSPYKNLPHGPLVIDDFVGDVLETKEHMKPSQAKDVKKLLNIVAKHGLNNIPMDGKLTAAKLILVNHMNFDQATVLYNKYVGDWGGTSTAYRFDAVKDGKVVASVEKQPMKVLHLFASADHVELQEDHTYDMAAVRIQMQDEFGNLMCFACEPVELETEGDIELVGPSVVSLQGGMTGTYIKTTGKSGSGKLRIKAGNCESVEIDFTAHIKE